METEINAYVLDWSQVAPIKLLFVGDIPRAGVESGQMAVMKALHVAELVQML